MDGLEWMDEFNEIKCDCEKVIRVDEKGLNGDNKDLKGLWDVVKVSLILFWKSILNGSLKSPRGLGKFWTGVWNLLEVHGWMESLEREFEIS